MTNETEVVMPETEPVVKAPAVKKTKVVKKVSASKKVGATKKVSSAKKVSVKKAAKKSIKKSSKKMQAKVAKLVKTKLIRDSFAIPEGEYAALVAVKKACLKNGLEIKKTELIRIGIALVNNLSVTKVKTAKAKLTPISAGRPKK